MTFDDNINNDDDDYFGQREIKTNLFKSEDIDREKDKSENENDIYQRRQKSSKKGNYGVEKVIMKIKLYMS